MAFRVLIIGGTGQVGAAVVFALAAEPSCAEVVMVNRRAISLTADPRVRQVTLDTAAWKMSTAEPSGFTPIAARIQWSSDDIGLVVLQRPRDAVELFIDGGDLAP